MEQHELLLYVANCLEKLKIPYLITGSVASIAYGEPRLTNDIDIVADIGLDKVESVKTCFPEENYYLEIESMKKAILHRRQFNIIHPKSGLKVDVILPKKDAFDRSRFTRTQRLNVSPSRSASFASPEDVIIKKLEFYQKGGSDKHLRDIAGILKISGSVIDKSYVETWAERLDLLELWKSLLDKISE